MNKLNQTPLSVLNLAPVAHDDTMRDAMNKSTDLAQHTESLGYQRFWLAEHHNMDGIASAATSVLMNHVAEHTSSIRIGAGGIMLPNHAPLTIAEQFGTLGTLHPDRIDLGIGRAPGTDQLTARALRQSGGGAEQFPEMLNELINYFEADAPQRVEAYPGRGVNVPVWLLGSSSFSARLAGRLGRPFAFAAHFAPAQMMEALKVYHENFQPSAHLDEPYAMAAINVLAADTNEEAEYLATSLYQKFVNLMRNQSLRTQPPVETMEGIWHDREKMAVQEMLKYSYIGDAARIKQQLENFIETTKVNEVMISTEAYDHEATKRSFEITAALTHDQ
ncbi:luciferase family oxidoreductase group 1 [Salsuginibacillus halophilus]|uniref:Luciferase family oxidoreductase group 1 n=1 Tax=Salsuginibacillus halophilus TaxID=517424 RepID=A0A2P8HDW0_9BACI|nr:LLM class flavin-dependent oxidoreductase [Salsuginibacillus halophilus]PSL44392.1 luciferase family oxidoreductase group 1 [Salsuginibacillus halophilus]